MTDKLKPVKCGCGGEAHHDSASCWNPEEEEWMPNFWHRVICKNCGTQTKAFYTEAEAVTTWNRAMGITHERAVEYLQSTGWEDIPMEYFESGGI